jgi:hypothetical protein
LQHQDSIKNLNWARESADLSSKDIKQSLALTERNVAIADSSLKLTRQSNERAEKGLRLTERNMFLTTEISKAIAQPFVCIDTVMDYYIKDIVVGSVPYTRFRIINAGATPAYEIFVFTNIIPEHYYKLVDVDSIINRIDTVGFFLGVNKPLDMVAYFMEFKGIQRWTTEDSTFYSQGAPLLFTTLIIYKDTFGDFHFTEQGFIQTKYTPGLVGLMKYNRSDHDKKTHQQINPKSKNP